MSRHLLLLLFCITGVYTSNDPINDAFLPFTRIMNGVFLQKEILTNEKVATEIVGELLNVPSLDQILSLKIDDQEKKISKAAGLIAEIPSIDSSNTDKTLRGLQSLTKAKEDESKMNPESFQDPAALLETSLKLGSLMAQQNKDIDKSRFEKISKVLKIIQEKEAASVDKDELKAKLTEISENMVYAQNALENMADYKQVYADFYRMNGIHEQIGPYLNISKSIGIIVENYEDISEVDAAVPILTSQSSTLRSSQTDFDAFSKLFLEVKKTFDAASQLFSTVPKKLLTSGYPNGVEDLKKILEDVKHKLFREKLEDTKEIQKALTPISKSSSQVDKAFGQLKKLKIDGQVFKDFEVYEQTFSKVLEAVKANNENIEQDLQKVGTCVKLLKKDTSVPDFKKLEKVTAHIKVISDKLSGFNKVMMELTTNTGFAAFKDGLIKIREGLTELGRSSTNDEDMEEWNKIRALEFLKTHETLFNIIQKLDMDPFKFGGKNLPVGILADILASATRSNLFETLKCLPSSSPDISKLIDSGKKVEVLKKEKTKLTAVASVILAVIEFQTASRKAINEMEKTKEDKEIGLIKDLPKESHKTLADFLRESSLVIDFVKIKENEKSVLVVAKPSDQLKSAVQQIKNSDTVFSDDVRSQLVGLMDNINEFFKSVGSIPMKSFDDLIKILDSAAKVKPISIKNSQILHDPIAKELALNSNPEIQKTSDDFRIVSTLNLDFTSSSVAGTLKKDLESLLDSFFPQKNGSGSDENATEASGMSTLTMWLLIGGSIGLLVIVFVVFGVLKCKKKWIFKEEEDIVDPEDPKKPQRKSRSKIPHSRSTSTAKSSTSASPAATTTASTAPSTSTTPATHSTTSQDKNTSPSPGPTRTASSTPSRGTSTSISPAPQSTTSQDKNTSPSPGPTRTASSTPSRGTSTSISPAPPTPNKKTKRSASPGSRSGLILGGESMKKDLKRSKDKKKQEVVLSLETRIALAAHKNENDRKHKSVTDEKNFQDGGGAEHRSSPSDKSWKAPENTAPAPIPDKEVTGNYNPKGNVMHEYSNDNVANLHIENLDQRMRRLAAGLEASVADVWNGFIDLIEHIFSIWL